MSDEKRLIDLLIEDNAPRRVSLMGRDVYVSQLTMSEQGKLKAMFPDDIGGTAWSASAIILKCRDANGEPIFTSDDRAKLMGAAGAGRFAAVWAAINGATVDEQAEK